MARITLPEATATLSIDTTKAVDGGISPREAMLRQLLPHDYEYARDSGLIDMFDYNPEIGDGLFHTLSGDLLIGEDGSFIPQGFHHEESGGMVWGSVRAPDGTERKITRVDRQENGAEKFVERLGEPYLGYVAIGDRPKFSTRRDPKTGELTIKRASNTMFPKEYDALAVMQAVRMAYNNRDKSTEQRISNNEGNEVIVSEGTATMIDGVTQMPIRLIINPINEKVMVAIPQVKQRNGQVKPHMKPPLTEDTLQEHVTYGMLKKG